MRKCEVQFANEKVKKAFEELEDKKLKEFLMRAFCDIEENPFCGVQVPKNRIPKEYIRKFGVHNVWKYDLPSAWRLIYSIKGGQVIIISIVLEWMDHKEYKRKFKY